MKGSHVKMALSLLTAHERRVALRLLVLMIIGAFSSGLMVWSILPFLSVFSRPQIIHEQELLSWFYEWGGFTSDYWFLIALGAGSGAVIIAANLIMILQTWAVSRFVQLRFIPSASGC